MSELDSQLTLSLARDAHPHRASRRLAPYRREPLLGERDCQLRDPARRLAQELPQERGLEALVALGRAGAPVGVAALGRLLLLPALRLQLLATLPVLRRQLDKTGPDDTGGQREEADPYESEDPREHL